MTQVCPVDDVQQVMYDFRATQPDEKEDDEEKQDGELPELAAQNQREILESPVSR